MNEDRTVPNDLAAERALLGAVLIHADLLLAVAPTLRPVHFFRSAHNLIFAAMLSLSAKSVAIDMVTLKDELVRSAQIDTVGGAAYLSGLTEGVPRSSNIEHYAGIVLEKSRLRNLIAAANRMLNDAYEGSDPDAILDRAGQDIFALRSTGSARRELTPVGDILQEVAKDVEEQAQSGRSIVGLSSGYSKLDRMLSGLQPRKYLLLAARPGMGKTALALNIAQTVAQDGQRVAVFSIEMGRKELTLRMLSATAQINSQSLQRGNLTEMEWRRFGDAMGKLHDLPIHIDDTNPATIWEIRSKARAMKAHGGLGLVVVDYIQLMSTDEKSGDTRDRQLGVISAGFKQLSKELDIPVLVLAQLSRANESRRDKHPQLSDLRECGSFEADADVVMFIHREEMYPPVKDEDIGVAELMISKQRAGPIGTVKMGWVKEHTRFTNLESGDMF